MDYQFRLVDSTIRTRGVSQILDGTYLATHDNGPTCTRPHLETWVTVNSALTFRSVTQLQDGTQLGVEANGTLWQTDTVYGDWTVVATNTSLTFSQVVQLTDGSFLGVSNNQLYGASSLASTWVPAAPSKIQVLWVGQLRSGTYFAVSTQHSLYEKPTFNLEWDLVPNGQLMLSVSQLIDGTLVGVAIDNTVWTRNDLTAASTWTALPPVSKVQSIAPLADGGTLAIGLDGTLHFSPRLPVGWTILPMAQGSAVVENVVQLTDGTFVGTGMGNNTLYRRGSLSAPWQVVATQRNFTAINQANDGTLLICADQQLFTAASLTSPLVPVANIPNLGIRSVIQLFDGSYLAIDPAGYNVWWTPSLDGAWTTKTPFASHCIVGLSRALDGTVIARGCDQFPYRCRWSRLVGNIDHVVVLMLENRGFDSLLGQLYTPSDPPKSVRPPLTAKQRAFDGIAFVEKAQITNTATINKATYTVTASPGVRASNTPGVDPWEEYEHVNLQLYGSEHNPTSGQAANMGGFLQDYASKWSSADATAIDQIEQILKLYSPADAPMLNTLARAYATCDRWFSSVPTQTNANRAFSLCGSSYGLVNNGFLTTNPVDAEFQNDRFPLETVFNVLHRGGTDDWKIFWEVPYPPPPYPNTQPYTRNVFPFIDKYVSNPDSHFASMNEFFSRARSGSLGAVSYLEPKWGGQVGAAMYNGDDYHPPSDTTVGEYFVKKVFDALSHSPKWSRTLLVITFDEHGGTYDHAPPDWNAQPPWGSGRPTFPLQKVEAAGGAFQFDRFGVRVPTLLISPLVDESTVFRSPTTVPFDHTSLIATLLDWQQVDRRTWNLGARSANAPTFDHLLTRTTARTDDPFAVTPARVGTPMNIGSPFYLQSSTGTCLVAPVSSGPAFPYLGTLGPAAQAVAHTFRLGWGALKSGMQVQLYISMELPDTGIASGADATALGAWTGNNLCYYYPTLDLQNYQQQVWILNKVGGRAGDPIKYGDQVQLVNVFFNQGLKASGANLTTASGPGDVWVLAPAGTTS